MPSCIKGDGKQCKNTEDFIELSSLRILIDSGYKTFKLHSKT